MEKVTVLMAEYNTKKEQLKESIESILKQTYKNFEFIIVDDCSKQENIELIESYKDDRIRLVKNEKNLGLAASLNKGIELANTDYIIRMDTDDIAKSDRIEKQIKFAKANPQYSIIGGQVNFFDDEGIYYTTSIGGEISKDDLIKGTPFIHPTMLINKKHIQKIGGYPLYRRCQDYAMVMNMYANGFKGFIMNDILLDYRMDTDGYKKKKFKYRILEFKIRFHYYKKMKIKLFQYVYCIKPLIAGIMPKKLLQKHQKNRFKKEHSKERSVNKEIMKIMFNTSSMGKGGAERVISVLANELIKENEVSILLNTTKDKAYELNKKIKLLETDEGNIPIALIRNIKRINISAKIIKEEKPDIIISFLPMPSYRILLLRRFIKIPIIICDRNDPNKEYQSFINNVLMKTLYPKADGFVFQTEEQKKYFNKTIQSKSVIIYNPIKDEFLNANKSIQKKDTIISVGRLVEQKNQKMLIEAFSKIAKKYPNYNLKIFGAGPLESTLENQIKKLNLSDRVILCGICDNIKKELERAKIFVLSSDYEGMPNALIEAMAVGLPVISTDCPCGGPRELIKNKENGILVKVGDVEELAEKLEFLIQNQEKAKLLGEKAEKIKDKLNLENILNQWKSYIMEVKQK